MMPREQSFNAAMGAYEKGATAAKAEEFGDGRWAPAPSGKGNPDLGKGVTSHSERLAEELEKGKCACNRCQRRSGSRMSIPGMLA